MPVKHSVIIPAAGLGSRFSATLPKQYARLKGSTVLHQTVSKMQRACPNADVIVTLHPNDTWFSSHTFTRAVQTVEGGQTRAQSVINALQALSCNPPDWVLVHDAARPCVSVHDVQALINRCLAMNQGGLLVGPIQDTLKYVVDGQVERTLNRDQIYRALTPQMFPYKVLVDAYQAAMTHQWPVTDEASAVEAFGIKPLCVMSTAHNLKITYPQDLHFAEWLLEAQ